MPKHRPLHRRSPRRTEPVLAGLRVRVDPRVQIPGLNPQCRSEFRARLIDAWGRTPLSISVLSRPDHVPQICCRPAEMLAHVVDHGICQRCTDSTSAAGSAGATVTRRTHGRQDRRAPGLARTNRSREDAEKGGGQRLDRQRAGVLRLLHLRAGRGAGLPEHLLPVGQPAGRHRRVVRDVRCRLRGPADRRVRPRPLGGHPRSKDGAGPLHAADGRVDVPGRAAAHLQRDRHLGADPAGHPAADPGLRGRRRDLRRQRDDPGTLAVRPARATSAASPCRACRPARSSPPRCSCRCPRSCRRKPSSPGAGGFRSCSARSSWSPVTSSGAGSTRPPPSGGGRARRGAGSADRHGRQGERQRHAAGHLHGADERDPDGGDGVRCDVCDQRRVRRRLDHDELPVDLGVRQHRRGHPDPVRREPVRQDRPSAGDDRRLPRAPGSWPTRTCTSSARQPRRWRSCSRS